MMPSSLKILILAELAKETPLFEGIRRNYIRAINVHEYFEETGFTWDLLKRIFEFVEAHYPHIAYSAEEWWP